MQAYSDPEREQDPFALPDLEIFEHRCGRRNDCCFGEAEDGSDCSGSGFYYWYRFPGCLPDSEPEGPFTSSELALQAARDWLDDPFGPSYDGNAEED